MAFKAGLATSYSKYIMLAQTNSTSTKYWVTFNNKNSVLLKPTVLSPIVLIEDRTKKWTGMLKKNTVIFPIILSTWCEIKPQNSEIKHLWSPIIRKRQLAWKHRATRKKTLRREMKEAIVQVAVNPHSPMLCWSFHWHVQRTSKIPQHKLKLTDCHIIKLKK